MITRTVQAVRRTTTVTPTPIITTARTDAITMTQPTMGITTAHPAATTTMMSQRVITRGISNLITTTTRAA